MPWTDQNGLTPTLIRCLSRRRPRRLRRLVVFGASSSLQSSFQEVCLHHPRPPHRHRQVDQWVAAAAVVTLGRPSPVDSGFALKSLHQSPSRGFLDYRGLTPLIPLEP